MAGIHLPDIGKLGIHIATGIRDKKKVAPSNMAENARYQALSTRLESEKHERSRVLNKEERRMKRKKHRIDKRRQDIERNRRQEHNSNVDNSDGKIFLPSISLSKTANSHNYGDELISEDPQDFDPHPGKSSSAIFPIQDEFSQLLESSEGDGRFREKRKIVRLPSIETNSGDNKIKHRKTAPLRKNLKANNLTNKDSNTLEIKDVDSGIERELRVMPNPQIETFNVSIKQDQRWDKDMSDPTGKEEVGNQSEDHRQAEKIVSSELIIDESVSSENPFNYLLLKEHRRKALHQNLEDAFRAIKTCRYIRTPIRRAEETDFDEEI
ncbi:uncharacterized protein LOC111319375 [Stylophora pistillata]|nr:uncharacterized protein LOC111319375 [Stylophora pistillata]